MTGKLLGCTNSVMRTTIVPTNDTHWHAMRANDVTSTESAALFGLSPYLTAFELYHRKKSGSDTQIDSTGRMAWGQRLQDAIARGLAEDYGVKIRRVNAYMSLDDVRMGSSFDYEVVGNDGADTPLSARYVDCGTGNLEIKNVDYIVFRDQWVINDDKSIEAPAHIELQVQHQLHVSNRPWAAIGVLVAGNSPQVIIRERDVEVGQAIEARVREFWSWIAADTPPAPSYPADAAFVCKLYSYADPGKVYDGAEDQELQALCKIYAAASQAAKTADEDKETAKAKILARIGDAERALLPGFSVSAGIVGPAHVEYDRKAYRNFRCTPKKEKPTP